MTAKFLSEEYNEWLKSFKDQIRQRLVKAALSVNAELILIKKIALICLLVSFCSCKSFQFNGQYAGKFEASGDDFHFSLVVQEDHTFRLTQHNFDVTVFCEGEWCPTSDRKILLKSPPDSAYLSMLRFNGFMEDTSIVVYYKNANRVRIHKTVYYRTK